MTIHELKSVYSGSVSIKRVENLPDGHTIRFATLYDGQLRNLSDDSLLNSTVQVIMNIPGDAIYRKGVPFLNISIK